MSIIDKLIQRLLSLPKDFTYSEARTLLSNLGFQECNKGRTSGSRVIFKREVDGLSIMLHKPHPGDVMKAYSVKQLKKDLEENGVLWMY